MLDERQSSSPPLSCLNAGRNLSLRLTCLQLSSSHSTSFCVAIPIFRSSAYEILPAVKLSSLAIAPRVVDLAAPFRPSKQKISPYMQSELIPELDVIVATWCLTLGTSNDRSSMAVTGGLRPMKPSVFVEYSLRRLVTRTAVPSGTSTPRSPDLPNTRLSQPG